MADESDEGPDDVFGAGPEHGDWTGTCKRCFTNIKFHAAVFDISGRRMLCGFEGPVGADDLALSGCAAAVRDERYSAPPLNQIRRPLTARDAGLVAISDMTKEDLDARLGSDIECDNSDCEEAGFCTCDE